MTKPNLEFEIICNSLEEAYLFLDKEGTLLWINQYADIAYENIFGGKFKLGDDFFSYFRNTNLFELFTGAFKESITSSSAQEVIAEITSVKNIKLWYLVSYTPIFDSNKNLMCLVMQARDLTKLKEAERQLQEQKDTLAEIARIQSHILRRPLANILGLTQIIKVNDDIEGSKEVIDRLIQSVDELDAEVKKIVNETSLNKHID